MSIPHFPKRILHTDPYTHPCPAEYYDFEDVENWKKEHERRLKEFFEWLESSGLLLESFTSEYEKYLAKKKEFLE